jgi:tetratricopeptide (TPR) repeat protein
MGFIFRQARAGEFVMECIRGMARNVRVIKPRRDSMLKLMCLGFAAAITLSSAALAAGDGGGSSDNDNSPASQKCKKGEVWNKTKKKCVKVESGVMPDEDLYQQGRALAKEGQYDWAIQVLAVIQNQEDPRVLNYTGYSHRKAGRLEIGITYYRKALAIDPNFNLAREYLGEGYAAAGRIDLARAELAEIGQRCGISCEEYKDLEKAIAAAN